MQFTPNVQFSGFQCNQQLCATSLLSFQSFLSSSEAALHAVATPSVLPSFLPPSHT